MKDIVIYCCDTIKENDALTNSTETSLKQNMEKKEYKNIKAVILHNKRNKKTHCKATKVQEIQLPKV